MRNTTFHALIGVLLLHMLPFTSDAQPKMTELQSTIHQLDSLFWASYNNCDITSFQKFFTDDVEFYHDKGGITLGLEALTTSVKQNLCGRKNFRIRRAPVQGTQRIYPLESNGSIYGAIISGDHDFFITENDKPEYHSGQAKFVHVWLLKNKEWKMSRVLSFDHHEVH
ncbi:MAG TPA: nuclear transport factor 2 family protein [Flavitalea sp.]|nr:nuclear transport factor 2 family protein [Flavitalea sp.]